MTTASLDRRLSNLEGRSTAGEGELILGTDPDALDREAIAAEQEGRPRPTLFRINTGPAVDRTGTTLSAVLAYIAANPRRIHDRAAA